ncbi:RING finger protein 223-like [Bufo bufo]|uniref:RING finger protein 223-like n=1 Tax=Bufo bufo TaxID=8384 RepID=UPI001ABE666D|nr:RING finger protein 223-like [Bufo bufo]XP_040260864.1 RING finger protein 223-like [Bufo bufo]
MKDMEPEHPVPECPICFVTYDNIFKTPLLLPCSHTFCMECLSKLCIFQKELETFCCPMCRAVVTIPPGGVPHLPPNMGIVSRFPPWLGELQKVWMEGSKLCWKKDNGQNCVTSTQNTLAHFPPGQDENMVISVFLLSPAQPHFSRPGDLVIVPRQPHYHRCDLILRNYGCILWIFICCILMLFFVVFFPTYLLH